MIRIEIQTQTVVEAEQQLYWT